MRQKNKGKHRHAKGKGSTEISIGDLSTLSPIKRIIAIFLSGKYTWLALQIIITLITSSITISINSDSIRAVLDKLLNVFLPTTYAQSTVSAVNGAINQTAALPLKDMLIGGMMLLLFVLFLWALITLTFSKQTKAISVATEAVKTLMGFFIGTLTGFSAS